jgi:DNA-binding transcriptional regulator YhcF (GntR family)
MELRTNKKSGVPLYIQIKDQVKQEIKNKRIVAGQKMPTERDLAKMLRTSRNTISSAYKLLEQEGVLVSHQGKGTFVAVENREQSERRVRHKICSLIETSLDDALESGLSTAEFIVLVQEKVREREEFLRKINAVFVECNIEQARVFSRELADMANFNVRPLTLTDLRLREEWVEEMIKDARYIFTTFSHINEVRDLTAGLEKEVYGFAVKPCLEGIVKIARHPGDTKFGLVAISKEFHQKFLRNLKATGLENLNISFTNTNDEDELQKLVTSSDVIIVSPGRGDEIETLMNGDKEVIIFNTTLDLGSVRAVVSKISGLKH